MGGGGVEYAVVATAAGTAVVAARGGRVVASFLPGPDGAAQVARLRERFPDARERGERALPAAGVLRRWAEGRGGDPATVPVDLAAVAPFAGRVYRALRRVRPGRTVTYGELARRAGSPGAARAVGTALARNPLAPFVPCHRVLGADGGLHGFTAPGGIAAKARLLAMEGVDAHRDGANP